jgi:hypothetical protein
MPKLEGITKRHNSKYRLFCVRNFYTNRAVFTVEALVKFQFIYFTCNTWLSLPVLVVILKI